MAPVALRPTVVARSPALEREIHHVVRERRDQPFVELAVTLFEFTRSLHQAARRCGVDQLAFLAREGRILHDAFDRYQRVVEADDAVATGYLYVSRRSTFLPSLRPVADEDFARILELYPTITTAGLLRSMGLDGDGADEVLAEVTGGRDGPLDLDALKRNRPFRCRYEHQRIEQQRLLVRYLEQVTGSSTDPLHVVDVGWKGTMQDHLQALLGPERVVEGYYLGLVPTKGLRHGERKHGLLFDTRDGGTPHHRVFRHFKSLYELLLQADHGSVQSYRDVAGTVEPVLDTQPVEARVFRDVIGPVQEGVLEAFDALCQVAAAHAPLPDLGRLAARHHARMLYFPTAAEIDVVCRLEHFENFGQMEFVSAAVAGPRGGRQRAVAIAGVARDPRRLLGRTWPPLELRALGLSPLIPVVGAYRWVRELYLPTPGRS